jgi:hypothetical protein
MISLVPFYKQLDPTVEGSEVLEMQQIFSYRDALHKMHDSLVYHNQDRINFLVATDLDTNINLPCYRSDLSGLNIMGSLSKSNLDVVRDVPGNKILCGADHLITGDLASMFEGNDSQYFDIAVASKKGSSINNTAVLVRDNNHYDVVDFFQKRLDIYQELKDSQKTWFGDQLSIQVLLTRYGIISEQATTIDYGYFNVGPLKILIFHYGGPWISPYKTGKRNIGLFLDFKGARRKVYFQQAYDMVMNCDCDEMQNRVQFDSDCEK